MGKMTRQFHEAQNMALTQSAFDLDEIIATCPAGGVLHPVSRMSTDFLNQYNEVAMTLDMLGDWPEMLEDFREWRSRSYIDHFKASGLGPSEVIIAAYDETPADIKIRFEAMHAMIGSLTHAGVQALLTVPPGDALKDLGAMLAEQIRFHIDRMDSLINDHGPVRIVEDMLPEELPGGLDQSAIDSLFD
jgi:hypothetical protein